MHSSIKVHFKMSLIVTKHCWSPHSWVWLSLSFHCHCTGVSPLTLLILPELRQHRSHWGLDVAIVTCPFVSCSFL